MTTTIRACLYARYSTDQQRQTSIDDQLRAARARAEREGWEISAMHADEGISGSTPVALRRGGKALLADALAGRFQILIVEGLDRLSRELGEAEQLVKRLEHRSIRIIGTADGYDTEARGRKVMRIARGLVNELYLDDLREKTHRGLAGQMSRGLSAGGRSYGYGTVDVDGGRRVVVNEAEAKVVREIFSLFADGESARAIAHGLNTRGVASPRGGTWAVSALIGDAKKGLGLLNNELYIGRVVWNRRQWLKDPDTGKRRYVDRPHSEWQERDQPELRIVDQALWDRVRARRSPQAASPIKRGQPAKTLFSGLLRCAQCGGPMTGINAQRYGCGNYRDRGTTVCSSSMTVMRDKVDNRLLAELREELLSPTAQAELQTQVKVVLAEQRRGKAGDADAARRRLQALQGEIGRLADAVAQLGLSDTLATRLQAAERERDDLRARLSAEPAPTRVGLANVMARYRRLLLQLKEVLSEEADRARTRQILAELLGPVTIGRDAETGAAYADFDEPAERLLLAAVGESPMLVAGARNGQCRRAWL